MRKKCSVVLGGLLIAPALVLAQGSGPWVKKSFVILASTPTYQQALQVAKDAAKQTGIRLDLRGLTRHPENKLTFSQKTCDGMGFDYPCYLTRAYDADGEYLTIDFSGGFEDFRPGYFIVTAAGNEPGASHLKVTLARVRTHFPDAYLKTTRVYVGCMH